MTDPEIALTDEFASTMQQLVAEAEKALLPGERANAETPEQLGAIAERLERLERLLAAGFQKLSSPKEEAPDWQWTRIDENLRALRNSESVNQRLFNSLHEELKLYRDNFLRDTLQKPFIRDLIHLFDDLTLLAADLGAAGAAAKGRQGRMTQWSQNLHNTIHSVLEIMHRLEVTQIEPVEKVDRALHKVVGHEPAEAAEQDGEIVRRLKAGFTWRDQILRPEEVIAKRFAGLSG